MGDINNSETVQITGTILVIAIIVLFLVVVFVLFLHAYAKWFWLRVEEPPAPPTGRRRRRHAFELVPVQERGLDPLLLRSLPVVIIQSQEDGLECSVCLSEIAQGESARVLPKCKHGFHVECIDMWFHSHSTCPLCRTPVSPQPTLPLSSSNNNQLLLSSDFPTNVLVSGDQTRVSAGPTTSSTAHHLPSSSTNALAIDVPPQLSDSFGDDESKSPTPTRLRSLKRLLSRDWDKRKAPTSTTNSADEV